MIAKDKHRIAVLQSLFRKRVVAIIVFIKFNLGI